MYGESFCTERGRAADAALGTTDSSGAGRSERISSTKKSVLTGPPNVPKENISQQAIPSPQNKTTAMFPKS